MARNIQLFRMCRIGFRQVSFVTEGKPSFRDASTVPAFYWPNGRWCVPVNLYLDHLWASNRKHRPRGGTLGTYSAYLTPLVHYVFARKGASFARLTNSDFIQCVKLALEETVTTKAGAVAKRNSGNVRDMAHVWLSFLLFLADLFNWKGFIGENGAIRAIKTVTKVGRGALAREITTWSHPSIPKGPPLKRRFPITERVLKALRAAAAKTKSPFLRRRRLAMLELFDAVGFRRIEASLLRVSDVRDAINAMRLAGRTPSAEFDSDDHASASHILSFRMRKQPDGNEERLRHVPVSAVTLQFLAEYLMARDKFVRRMKFTETTTEGCFFFNLSRGTPLLPNTFTQEINHLVNDYLAQRKPNEPPIQRPCSPHMIRARYITREFVRLIMSHNLETMDDFRRALLDVEHFKKQVTLITGHISPASLDFYIDLAFAEVAELAKTKARVEAQRDLDAVAAANERYRAAIANGEDALQAGRELSAVLSALAQPPSPPQQTPSPGGQ